MLGLGVAKMPGGPSSYQKALAASQACLPCLPWEGCKPLKIPTQQGLSQRLQLLGSGII